MLEFLAKNWWVLVVRGVAAVIFGVLTFVWPAISLAVLVLMWGAYALVDGVFAIIGSFRGPRSNGFPWWIFITGIAGVLAGILTFVNPAITAVALLLLIAAFAIVRGVMEIVAAIRLRKEIDNEWLLILAGVVSIAFGVLVALFPGAGALAIVLWIGVFAIVVGVIEIVLGFKLKGRAPGGGGKPVGTTAF
jgi:uncharacterized membrane protein HdeD (DUF308 family)